MVWIYFIICWLEVLTKLPKHLRELFLRKRTSIHPREKNPTRDQRNNPVKCNLVNQWVLLGTLGHGQLLSFKCLFQPQWIMLLPEAGCGITPYQLLVQEGPSGPQIIQGITAALVWLWESDSKPLLSASGRHNTSLARRGCRANLSTAWRHL